jgi:hypothetical protein
MSDHVWLSTVFTQAEPDIRVMTDISEDNVDLSIQAITLNEKGLPFSRDMCPKRIWAIASYNQQDGEKYPSRITVPDLFNARGHLIVSSSVADIMREFNLGEGALYPVSQGVFQDDNQTQIEGEYFTWNFGNTKTTFLEQYSPKVEAMSSPSERGWCHVKYSQSDDDIAVSIAALSGPDVWVDPILFKSIFLSGSLGDALVGAGFKERLYLVRCRVIQ